MSTKFGSQIHMYRFKLQDMTMARQKASVTSTGLTNHANDHIARNANIKKDHNSRSNILEK